ncbi:MAG: pilus assembly protein PilP [Methylotenera sp.]|uniref:pilus assembly protein PilP n=1 Tax=Methylotenera sp. TaxID=2051956 RepID=UPI00248855E5|nr:pilus assembly protein PilP [Methylotenera sp.]MDI1308717.1 pilus assembly protein PilP [Methylotenera sp.]
MNSLNFRFKRPSAHKMLVKASLIGLLAMSLVACNGDGGDDLDSFIKNAANTMHPKIKPLPEVKPYLALQYNADGKLTDPFRARKASNNNSVLQPNMNRPREPMEAYPLESVKYVGQLSKVKLTYALLLTPDNGVQQVKIGNYVGQNYGMVTKITDSEVELKEIVQDDLSGDWIERVSNLPLQE